MRGVAWLASVIFRKRRRIARQQIEDAFQISSEEADKLACQSFIHLGIMIAELSHAFVLTPETLENYIDFSDIRETDAALLAAGKGLIVVTGHLGNWELAASFARGISPDLLTVARPLDNPYLDQLVNGWRGRLGMTVLPKGDKAALGALKHLKKGGIFFILLDQNAGGKGIFPPFFGIPASTMDIAAQLSIRTGAPLIVNTLMRESPFRFKAVRRDPHYPDTKANRSVEALRLTAAMNADLENIIREYPDQWLWIHRRWKTRPPVIENPLEDRDHSK